MIRRLATLLECLDRAERADACRLCILCVQRTNLQVTESLSTEEKAPKILCADLTITSFVVYTSRQNESIECRNFGIFGFAPQDLGPVQSIQRLDIVGISCHQLQYAAIRTTLRQTNSRSGSEEDLQSPKASKARARQPSHPVSPASPASPTSLASARHGTTKFKSIDFFEISRHQSPGFLHPPHRELKIPPRTPRTCPVPENITGIFILSGASCHIQVLHLHYGFQLLEVDTCQGKGCAVAEGED